MNATRNGIAQARGWFLLLILCVGLYFTMLYHYLLFHALVELFSIVVAAGIFMIGWNSRQYLKNNYLLFISVAYLFIGVLDLLHTLAYKGMPIFTDYDYYANQLWIATRYLESLTLLSAFLFLAWEKDLDADLLFFVFFTVFALIVLSIFVWKVFPVCFVDGVGLTPFKKISEYVICAILIACLFLLRYYRRFFNPVVGRKLFLAICCTIVSELAFTFYVSNYGLSNVIGHYFKLFSFLLVYLAIIRTGITEPYELIFRELKEKEESLERARESADAANRAKSDFLAAMSHEIRTPMNAILGMTEVTLQSRMELEQYENLKTIRDASRHLLVIINDILDFSKIEAGRIELESIHFDILHTLKSVRRIFSMEADQRGLYLEMEHGPDVPQYVQGDPHRVKQILVNLISNGLKFTDQGGVSVRLEVDVQEAADGDDEHAHRLRFEVRDTGIGIPEASRDRIFERFSQADSSTTRRYGGSGLGLAISRRLALLMGGELTVESVEGEGSLFILTLPMEEGDPGQVAGSGHDQQLPTGQYPQEISILAVEDNPLNRTVMERFMNRLGYGLLLAANGREALKCLSERGPDVVLMDVEMPEMDGLEATRRIRSGEAGQDRAQVPIIGMTAHMMNDIQAECLDAGMDDCLIKPLDFYMLRSLLLRYQGGRSGEFPEDGEPEGGSGTEPPESLINDKALNARFGGDKDLMQVVLRTFLSDSPHRLEHLVTLTREKDWERLCQECHSFKGSLGLVESEQALEALRRLENAVKKRDAEWTDSLLQAFLAIMDSLVRDMECRILEDC